MAEFRDDRNQGLDPMGDRRPDQTDRTDLSGRVTSDRDGTLRDDVLDRGTPTNRDENERRAAAMDPDANAPVDGNAVGGVSGLAAGAAIGAVTGGPIGAVIGAAAGAITGVGVAKGVDMAVDHEEEDAYWRDNYATRPYAKADRDYEHYRPAYQYGWETRSRHAADRRFDDVEPDLERGWNDYRGTSGLGWTDARHAARDAWTRIESRVDRTRRDI